MTLAYVGLGSNLDRPLQQVQTAANELAQIRETRLLNVSSFYGSEPMGPQDQPDYVNAVAAIETGLDAETLLAALHAIEDRHGRQRVRHWGPRTLDLDLLLYGDEQLQTGHLTVPHPGMHQRAFVLVPLLEIAPDVIIPGVGVALELLTTLDADSLTRLQSH